MFFLSGPLRVRSHVFLHKFCSAGPPLAAYVNVADVSGEAPESLKHCQRCPGTQRPGQMSSSETRMPRDPDAGTGEAPDPETCPATSSSGCSSSVEEKETSEISECKRQFNCESLEEALEIARQCAALKKEGWNEWNDNTWEQTLKLRYLLTLAAKPDFVPPARFQQAMETCMKCLLHAPQGQLMQPARLLQLLDSPEAGPLLRYLTWLEESLK
ncbi:hypothetical protein AK812_SmicGene30907, partial [Symbiodinium microadriaticum]